MLTKHNHNLRTQHEQTNNSPVVVPSRLFLLSVVPCRSKQTKPSQHPSQLFCCHLPMREPPWARAVLGWVVWSLESRDSCCFSACLHNEAKLKPFSKHKSSKQASRQPTTPTVCRFCSKPEALMKTRTAERTPPTNKQQTQNSYQQAANINQ